MHLDVVWIYKLLIYPVYNPFLLLASYTLFDQSQSLYGTFIVYSLNSSSKVQNQLTHVPVSCHSSNFWKCPTRIEECLETCKTNDQIR